ncbi:MAG: nitroreductase [Pseudohongiellaceae bacterium]|jgi:nitroreductase
MDALTALHTRTSSPRLIEPGPTAPQMKNLLCAALRAADHALLQPWRFLSIGGESRAKLGALFVAAAVLENSELSTSEKAKIGAKAMRAPLILVVVASPKAHFKVPEIEQKLSAAAATQNILLAAFAQGLGAVWRTGDMAYSATVKQGLGLAPEESIIGFIYLGTSSAPARTLAEVDPADFLHEW